MSESEFYDQIIQYEQNQNAEFETPSSRFQFQLISNSQETESEEIEAAIIFEMWDTFPSEGTYIIDSKPDDRRREGVFFVDFLGSKKMFSSGKEDFNRR